ncbi:error-prone DNA polymerase [Mycobacteroides abscessus subsp. bolletii 1S-154-0310]|uniref:Error-prone DNA polymerase n=3 Tax=Mycobacteroides abscessus TaxID=36809 RepID=A0A829MJ22_9MYCO|nr:error-prone DNA polymerase [Mycobacteroides abscessus]ESV56536.1 DNA polymerase III, alpha subunit [Mycobacteroides abscessus MAB_082312_2258]ESV64937.1 DNA polymerase III, alpha subunit [Mycobacteroides abscessus MAB_091912_2446]AFN64168.2 DNA polymerase [Mycobacteroides abscessus subsp. massiliense str. GO 06]AMU29030.1 error-prone DNA polymerase [Mycobacteroides abscessus]AMU38646.1 error-prone DNA polymerase [Mycobacteroides abscessus]
MGWSQGPSTWTEMERVLDGRRNPHAPPGDGGDGPAWSRRRQPYEPPPQERGRSVVPYAELHAHSAFSFLDGASLPEEMAQEAARLGLKALAITDHNGFYGVVRFAEAAKELGLPTVFGAELSLGGQGNTEESVHLLVLARGQEGYRRLSRQMSAAHLSGGTPKDRKGKPRFDIDVLTEAAGGHWHILTGCRKGQVRRALASGGPAAAERALADLVDRFGADRVSIELSRHGHPDEDERNAHLAALASRFGVGVIATTAAHFATPQRRRLAMAMAAVRARKSLDDVAGWLDPVGGAHLRSGDEMARLFSHCPEVVTAAAELGEACAFDLKLIAPELPPFDVEDGHTEASFLRKLAIEGAARRYGPRAGAEEAYVQIEKELNIITRKGFPGYFLVVYDIARFCRANDILCQGRGSAVNSAVCYALGVTSIDPVAEGLLFERFMSEARDGEPDIDIDIESDRREEVIQYVYTKHGRDKAAQVANTITYRGRMAVRDMAKALGFAQGQQDAWSKQMGHWGGLADAAAVDGIPPQVIHLAQQIKDFPRHMGIHSGGMVMCDRPLADVVPVEWARMENRSVLQWDKDDCAAVGLVKFDLLGLGMLSALHYCIDLVAEHKGITVDLAHIDLKEPAVYEMLARADSVGVFQVESRAQMATLPRLKPTKFFDLVVEVALIRPGPIQGGSVHPYIRRYNGIDTNWEYEHPSMERALKKTLGVPLFQEQLMQLAVDVAGFTPAESDQLRRAMGSKRSPERMERLRARFYEGMQNLHGITGEKADRIYEKLYAFANFGFPESHAQSFASLVFYSAWFKLHHPAAFCAALLRAQPMGFYSPQSLVADARRHGVTVHGPDVNASLSYATLENQGLEVRIGLGAVRHVGAELAQKIVEERKAHGPFGSLLDLTGRIQLTTPQVEALATGGALGCFGMSRREALWVAGAAAAQRPDRLPGVGVSSRIPGLPEMGEVTRAAADVWATGVSPDSYPTQFLRARLDAMGVVPAKGLFGVPDGSRVLVAGAVTHRQRPATAAGVTFINLEDETGMVNVVCSVGLWARYRKLAVTARALIIRGQVQNASGAISVVADQLRPLDLQIRSTSRDFR